MILLQKRKAVAMGNLKIGQNPVWWKKIRAGIASESAKAVIGEQNTSRGPAFGQQCTERTFMTCSWIWRQPLCRQGCPWLCTQPEHRCLEWLLWNALAIFGDLTCLSETAGCCSGAFSVSKSVNSKTIPLRYTIAPQIPGALKTILSSEKEHSVKWMTSLSLASISSCSYNSPGGCSIYNAKIFRLISLKKKERKKASPG